MARVTVPGGYSGRRPSIIFNAPGPPDDGEFEGQLASGVNANDQVVEWWRWTGAMWVPLHAAPPYLRLTRTTAQSIANNTAATVDVTATDPTTTPDFTVDLSANTAAILVPGLYMVGVRAEFAAHATGYRRVLVSRAPTFDLLLDDNRGATPTAEALVTAAIPVRLAAGDVIYATVRQTSGGALNLSNFALSAAWLSP